MNRIDSEIHEFCQNINLRIADSIEALNFCFHSQYVIQDIHIEIDEIKNGIDLYKSNFIPIFVKK